MLTREKLEHHVTVLERRHSELEKQLRTDPPDYISNVLKKEKLLLKDEIRQHKRDMELL